jgi:PKD repeat protein
MPKASVMHRAAPILAALVGVAALAGCGGLRGGIHPSPDSKSAPPAVGEGTTGLPGPLALYGVIREVKLYDEDLVKSGAAFRPELPLHNCAVNGDNADFSPNWDPAGSHTFADLAYATYSFSAQSYTGEQKVHFGWATAPADPASIWIGVGNFAKQRWDWAQPGAADSLDVPNLVSECTAPDARVIVVVLLTGMDACSLEWLSLGPPTAHARLNLVPSVGPPPLDVEFDASGSFALGGITKYEWDFDGDGSFDSDTGTTSTTQHTYSVAGRFRPAVRITAQGGGTAVAVGEVTVYNEVEPNNDTGSANALPPLTTAFTWYGSSGSGPGYPGYDGGKDDYFTFDGSTGQSVYLRMELNTATGDIDMELLDAQGDSLARSTSTTSVEQISYTFTASDVAPFYLRVYAFRDFSDYTLTGAYGAPPTAELSANPTEGDPPLSVNFDASGSSDPDGPIAKYEWDWTGDGAYDFDSGATATANHVYMDAGIYNPKVRVTDQSGLTANAATLVVVGSIPYDEREDNDAAADSNALGALPVIAWRGSCGAGAGYSAYDGDNDDYASFTANVSDKVTVLLHLDPSYGNLNLSLYDNDGSYLAGSSGASSAEEMITYTFTASDAPPYQVRVYASTGYSDYTLDVARGDAPTADLQASPISGNPPLNVSFNASGSTDPDGPIAKYEWDWQGDGVFDYDSGATPTASHSYAQDGIYAATVRVTDQSGLTARASATIAVGAIPFDEREDNDDASQANDLPAGIFTGFRGSSGSGSGYAAYDGDRYDYFRLNAAVGETVSYVLHLDPAHGDLDLALLDSASRTLASSSSSTSPTETVTYTIQGADTAPFFVRVYDYRDYSDYTLTGTRYPVARLSANPTEGDPPLSVSFDASASTSTNGAIVRYEWDWDGDGSYDLDSGGTATANHTYSSNGIYHAVVRVTDVAGESATAVQAIIVGPIPYDERENNDSRAQANSFPAFPFSGWRGSSGTGAGYPGYDGDGEDYFQLSASTGQTVDLTLNLPPGHGDIDIKLYDSTGKQLDSSTGTGDTENINYTFAAGDTAPFFLRVYVYSGCSDYAVDGTL